MSFSDYFSEGVIKKQSVEEKIEFAKPKIKKASGKVNTAIGKLEHCKSIVLEVNAKMGEEKTVSIESYLRKNGG